MMLSQQDRIALLMHEGTQSSKGKTGLSVLRYSPNPVVVVVDHQCAGQDLAALTGIDRHVPIVTSTAEALSFSPTVLMIGIAPSGGEIPNTWLQEISLAVKAGINIVNGLHSPLAEHPQLNKYLKPGQWIWDVRQEPPNLTVSSGKADSLSCKRVLAVGTDMSVGKMSTTIELNRASLKQGIRSKHIATGQTSLMLGDDGIPLDAIRVDFAAGAVEQLMMRFGSDYDILFIEGQGSLLNPASSATLPLLRGSQPTHMILAHRAGQTRIRNFPSVRIPPLGEVIKLYESTAKSGGAFTGAKVVGISLNTGHLDENEAVEVIRATQLETSLPCTDVIRFGPNPLLEKILN